MPLASKQHCLCLERGSAKKSIKTYLTINSTIKVKTLTSLILCPICSHNVTYLPIKLNVLRKHQALNNELHASQKFHTIIHITNKIPPTYPPLHTHVTLARDPNRLPYIIGLDFNNRIYITIEITTWDAISTRNCLTELRTLKQKHTTYIICMQGTKVTDEIFPTITTFTFNLAYQVNYGIKG